MFGIGFGWNEDEAASHGVDDARPRRARAREHMLAMRALWRDDVGEFHGDYVEIAPSWSWPKPATRGGPPVLIGGAAGPKLFAHIAEYADGWIPIGGAGVRDAIPELHRACEARGRDPATLRIVPVRHGAVARASSSTTRRSASPRSCCAFPSGGRDQVLPRSTATPSSAARETCARRPRRRRIGGGVGRGRLHA